MLEAGVECEPGTPCNSDRRSLLRGTVLKVEIRLPPGHAPDELSVTSTRREVLGVSIEKVTTPECESGTLLHGWASFHGLGEAAIVVNGADGEIDRFTTTTYEADHLQLYFLRDAAAHGRLGQAERQRGPDQRDRASLSPRDLGDRAAARPSGEPRLERFLAPLVGAKRQRVQGDPRGGSHARARERMPRRLIRIVK